ncbi:MAG: M28 family peptidase [Acidobacteriia bacterium]|nr:M28 family peptidase [Terriglobia bacterium]
MIVHIFKSGAAFLGAWLLLMASASSAQQAPINLPPGWKQVPQGTGACSVEKSCSDLAPGMIRSAMGPSPLGENLRYLTDTIGGRVTGSPEADRAVGWAVEAFRHAGVDEVHTEKFTVPVGWSEGRTRVEVLSPAVFPVRLVSVGWSPSTPEGGITSDVIDVGAGDDAGFAKAGAAAKGAIILVHTTPLITWDDLNEEYETDAKIIDRALKAGVAAIFWMSTRPNLLLYRHTEITDGHLEKLPQTIVAREDAERIARFVASGQKVRVRFEMANHVGGPFESENVVAEIRGREKPDEFVLLGAHLDSWDLGTGALDDGCQAAMVIDAARVIHATGTIPRRSIRFVLFTGEEQVMLGSWAYAHAHRAELDRMIAAILFDAGTGAVTGYSLGGRKDALAAVREALEPLKPLGVKEFTTDATIDTDRYDFITEGVLTLVPNQEPANYMLNYHASSDTFDKVDIAELKKHSAIAAVTAFALADSAQRVAPRQSRPQIEQLLNETGLADEMKVEGFWPAWEDGTRGRQP